MLRALRFSRWDHSSPLRLVILAKERRAFASNVVTPLSLSYTVFDGPSPQPPLVFLHGLFGSKNNFQSLAKKLVLQTGRQVLTVDARNHGSSPHSSLMSYEAMSADVQLLLHQLHLNRCVLIGHSMGGKTAMVLSLQRPELVERLVCVDISPSETSAVTSFQAFLAAMRAVNIPRGLPRSTARRLAEEQLRSTIQEPATRNFLLTNLVSSEDQFMWRVNLEAISHHLNEILSFPDFQTPYSGPTLFLGGSKSEYISSNDYPEIERLFPEAEIQYVSNAGHWVHADQPQEFLTAVCNFLELPPP
ncbi:PREDICTED: alpha/beta hydrolase domain-containing protein 11 [Gekko japonicus]|uniref:sn-1-specific diacylglycerol lipase ABHD11 n=1 Tax=Gekko japonicus TaxID=146911 RepID=A0ABM1K5Q4_GEKJA|nr:PREDICTED: alpha/beta hydrolase domain-containing protein 11 [Gekko japonicus]